ncbi:MAG: flagellar biosynthesis protein FlhB [Alphaproteobacteria bacterium]
MADDSDDSQKTEEPTQKRLADAEKEGQIATSRDVGHFFMLLAGLAVVTLLIPNLARDLMRLFMPFLSSPHIYDLELTSAAPLLRDILGGVGAALAVPILALLGAAFIGNFIQHGPFVSASALSPKLDRISPIAGFKRMFGARSLIEFAKGLLKIIAVGSAAVAAVVPVLVDIESYSSLELGALLDHIQNATFRLLFAALAVMAVVAGLDYLYQRFELRKQLRMSREDMKEEYKQTEGDPAIKSRIRQIRAERAKKRMMQNLPKADVVIANPTHYAIALSYKPAEMAAPKVVAKGADFLALRIRAVAAEHGIPVVENKPLARALHDAVDIDDEVPAEHYVAVAQVIGYIMRLREKAAPIRR